MAKSGVVYGLWTAYKDRDGKVKTLSWGIEPWVEKELCGKSGIVDVLWRTKATHFLAGDDHPVEGVDAYAPVNDALERYGLSHLAKTFKKNRVDAAAFVNLDEDMLAKTGRGCRWAIAPSCSTRRGAWHPPRRRRGRGAGDGTTGRRSGALGRGRTGRRTGTIPSAGSRASDDDQSPLAAQQHKNLESAKVARSRHS